MPLSMTGKRCVNSQQKKDHYLYKAGVIRFTSEDKICWYHLLSLTVVVSVNYQGNI